MKLTSCLVFLGLFLGVAAQAVGATLSAQGEGAPRLYFTSGSITIAGTGALLVSHNAKIVFDGTQKTAPTAKPGKLAGRDADGYNNFTGAATISGEHFSVGMYATGISIKADGAGYAILFGTGTYTVGTGSTDTVKSTDGKWTLAPWDKGGDKKLDQKTIMITFGAPAASDNPLTPTPPPTTTGTSTAPPPAGSVAFDGTLTATGTGTDAPRLYLTKGSVTFTGKGPLLVSHGATVTFADGKTFTAKPGKLAGKDMDAYNDFNGTATVTGENFAAGMYGDGIAISATGTGTAILYGTGTYTTKTGNGNWTPAPWAKK